MAHQISKTLSHKINKLQTFTDFYFSDKNCFKLKMMPNWIETYGRSLNDELTGRQEFYPVFKQGTIIMINFGVNVGEELSGPHFGIVINAKDNNRLGKLTVLPLTSKYHKGHVRLEKNIVEEALQLIESKEDDLINSNSILENIIQENGEHLQNFLGNHVNDDKIFSKETIQVIVECFHQAKNNYNEQKIIEDSSEDIKITNNINLIDSFLEYIKNSDQFETNQELSSYYLDVNAFLSKMKISINKLKVMDKKIDGLKKLRNQLSKYNNDSFADIKNMTTVSKNRINKLSEYDISGNVTISDKSLDKIKDNIHSFLNI